MNAIHNSADLRPASKSTNTTMLRSLSKKSGLPVVEMLQRPNHMALVIWDLLTGDISRAC